MPTTITRRKSAKQRTRELLARGTQIRKRAELVATLLTLPYLEPEQAAFVAQTSAATIRRACASGSLAHVRVNQGKLIRIAPSDLRLWLSSAAHAAA